MTYSSCDGFNVNLSFVRLSLKCRSGLSHRYSIRLLRNQDNQRPEI